jgi:hypothetical protein
MQNNDQWLRSYIKDYSSYTNTFFQIFKVWKAYEGGWLTIYYYFGSTTISWYSWLSSILSTLLTFIMFIKDWKFCLN